MNVKTNVKMNAIEIKQLRGEMGLTQEDFAREVGVTLTTVARWETEKCCPSCMANTVLNQLWNKFMS